QVEHLTSSRGACGLFPSDVTKSETCWVPKDRISSSWDAPHTLQELILETWTSDISILDVGLPALFLVLFLISNFYEPPTELVLRCRKRQVISRQRATCQIESPVVWSFQGNEYSPLLIALIRFRKCASSNASALR